MLRIFLDEINSQCYLYYLISVYFHTIYAVYIVGRPKLPWWAPEFLYTGNVQVSVAYS